MQMEKGDTTGFWSSSWRTCTMREERRFPAFTTIQAASGAPSSRALAGWVELVQNSTPGKSSHPDKNIK